MLKMYRTWICIISFITLVVLAIAKSNTGNPPDGIFILTEWLLYITCFVACLFCIEEANK